ncbi:hypothetical protein [Streptomyces sp. NRRL S-1813]|uniref:hypothetical protein n=1 Tax=Streptomyces sp. NRRL S-1813 TaxID=1463888 RepID=UPI0004CB3E40|nr:hypothetical protein [Streptomyces sp. NRRL S-1813]
MTEPEIYAAEVRYEVDREGKVPAGRALFVSEEPGLIVATFRPGDASEKLCEQLNVVSRHIFRNGLWATRWGADESTEPSEHTLLKVRFEILPADAFPEVLVCLPRDRPGEFVWFIRDPHMSQQACDECNAYLEKSIRAGLWMQRWNRDEGETERFFFPDELEDP